MKQGDARQRSLNRRELIRLLGIGTGVLVSGQLLSACAVDPVTGRRQFMMMSESEEIALDRQRAPYQFSSDYGVLQDTNLNRYINEVGRKLAARSHRPQMPFSFRGVNTPSINAYAFPGGSIATTRGILVELENEAELAALLGHEIGHVCARHTAEQSSKGMLTNIFVTGAAIATSAVGFGGAANLVQNLGGIGAGALLAHYSRDNEREADALGMEYMTKAGYSPQGMVGLMDVLQRNKKNNPSAVQVMFATHPMSDERLATAQREATTTYRRYLTNPLMEERYKDTTAALRSVKPAITALQNGSTAMAKKNYQTAQQQFASALQIMPQDYTALVMMATCRFAMDQMVAAEQFARKATIVYPAEPQAHIITALVSINNTKYEQALEHLTAYDALLPGNPLILFYKGICLEQMQRTREAAVQYAGFLKQVRSGKQAQYARSRLKTWGYLK